MSPSSAPLPKGSTLTPAVLDDLCRRNRALERQLGDFMANVPSAREESLTEFLFWRWRALDKRFNYQLVHEISAAAEPGLGADFLLELWLSDATDVLPLLIQAKKFVVEGHDRYRHKLLYPEDTGDQLEILRTTADALDFLPRYLIYTGWRTGAPHEGAMYLVDTAWVDHVIPDPGKPLSLERVLEDGLAFHRLFCRTVATAAPSRGTKRDEIAAFIADDDGDLQATRSEEGRRRMRPRMDAPAYVQELLRRSDDGGLANVRAPLMASPASRWAELEKTRKAVPDAVAVYDLSAAPVDGVPPERG